MYSRIGADKLVVAGDIEADDNSSKLVEKLLETTAVAITTNLHEDITLLDAVIVGGKWSSIRSKLVEQLLETTVVVITNTSELVPVK